MKMNGLSQEGCFSIPRARLYTPMKHQRTGRRDQSNLDCTEEREEDYDPSHKGSRLILCDCSP